MSMYEQTMLTDLLFRRCERSLHLRLVAQRELPGLLLCLLVVNAWLCSPYDRSNERNASQVHTMNSLSLFPVGYRRKAAALLFVVSVVSRILTMQWKIYVVPFLTL